MKVGKSPRPDGFKADFLKANWDIIGEDVTSALKFYFEKSYMFSPLNSMVITLVPKTKKYCANEGVLAYIFL